MFDGDKITSQAVQSSRAYSDRTVQPILCSVGSRKCSPMCKIVQSI